MNRDFCDLQDFVALYVASKEFQRYSMFFERSISAYLEFFAVPVMLLLLGICVFSGFQCL